MKQVKLMSLGLLIVLIGISIGLIRLPHPLDILQVSKITTQVGPSSIAIQEQTHANIVAYIIIAIGVALSLIGFFRQEKS